MFEYNKQPVDWANNEAYSNLLWIESLPRPRPVQHSAEGRRGKRKSAFSQPNASLNSFKVGYYICVLSNRILVFRPRALFLQNWEIILTEAALFVENISICTGLLHTLLRIYSVVYLPHRPLHSGKARATRLLLGLSSFWAILKQF